jgi:hypothetical protein
MDVVKPSCSYKTFTTYRDIAEKHILPAFGPVLLAKLTTPQMQRFLNEKHQSGLSAKTVKHIRDCFRAALNVAVDTWDLIPKNPASKARPPDQPQRAMQVLDPDQAQAFLGLVRNHRLNALFSLAICLGRRQGGTRHPLGKPQLRRGRAHDQRRIEANRREIAKGEDEERVQQPHDFATRGYHCGFATS